MTPWNYPGGDGGAGRQLWRICAVVDQWQTETLCQKSVWLWWKFVLVHRKVSNLRASSTRKPPKVHSIWVSSRGNLGWKMGGDKIKHVPFYSDYFNCDILESSTHLPQPSAFWKSTMPSRLFLMIKRKIPVGGKRYTLIFIFKTSWVGMSTGRECRRKETSFSPANLDRVYINLKKIKKTVCNMLYIACCITPLMLLASGSCVRWASLAVTQSPVFWRWY